MLCWVGWWAVFARELSMLSMLSSLCNDVLETASCASNTHACMHAGLDDLRDVQHYQHVTDPDTGAVTWQVDTPMQVFCADQTYNRVAGEFRDHALHVLLGLGLAYVAPACQAIVRCPAALNAPTLAHLPCNLCSGFSLPDNGRLIRASAHTRHRRPSRALAQGQ